MRVVVRRERERERERECFGPRGRKDERSTSRCKEYEKRTERRSPVLRQEEKVEGRCLKRGERRRECLMSEGEREFCVPEVSPARSWS